MGCCSDWSLLWFLIGLLGTFICWFPILAVVFCALAYAIVSLLKVGLAKFYLAVMIAAWSVLLVLIVFLRYTRWSPSW